MLLTLNNLLTVLGAGIVFGLIVVGVLWVGWLTSDLRKYSRDE